MNVHYLLATMCVLCVGYTGVHCDTDIDLCALSSGSPHLSSPSPVAHKAEVLLPPFALSAATGLALFQLFHPSMRLSF